MKNRITYICVSGAFLLMVSACQKTPVPRGQDSPDIQSGSGEVVRVKMPHFDHPDEPENLLKNPGFEDGLENWTWLDWSKGWAPFALSTDHALEGTKSLYLPVLSTDNRPTVVWGGVQEIELSGDIPECIDGSYFVENWTSGDWKQYLQLVVIDLTHPLGPNRGQAQLRYIVSGSKEPPLTISNASYLFAEKERRDTPVIGRWTHFSVNPRADYLNSWQYTPGAGSKLRILFEGRYDLHHNPDLPARADVYYDDLYFGPKTDTRCVE